MVEYEKEYGTVKLQRQKHKAKEDQWEQQVKGIVDQQRASVQEMADSIQSLPKLSNIETLPTTTLLPVTGHKETTSRHSQSRSLRRTSLRS